jgi:hypothetical protein
VISVETVPATVVDDAASSETSINQDLSGATGFRPLDRFSECALGAVDTRHEILFERVAV